jgi:hypothetical protein
MDEGMIQLIEQIKLIFRRGNCGIIHPAKVTNTISRVVEYAAIR